MQVRWVFKREAVTFEVCKTISKYGECCFRCCSRWASKSFALGRPLTKGCNSGPRWASASRPDTRYRLALYVRHVCPPNIFEPATPLYGLHRFGLICKKTIFLTRERPIYRILSPKHIGYSRPSLMKYWRSREIYPVLTFDCVSTRRSLSSRFLRFVQKQPAPSRTQWRSQRTSFNHNLISCNLIFHRNMRKSYETVTH